MAKMAATRPYFGCCPRKGTKKGGDTDEVLGLKSRLGTGSWRRLGSFSAPSDSKGKEWCRGERGTFLDKSLEQSERKKGVDSDREREGRGGCEQDCISSLHSGHPNRQCQVFFLQAAWCISRWQRRVSGKRHSGASKYGNNVSSGALSSRLLFSAHSWRHQGNATTRWNTGNVTGCGCSMKPLYQNMWGFLVKSVWCVCLLCTQRWKVLLFGGRIYPAWKTGRTKREFFFSASICISNFTVLRRYHEMQTPLNKSKYM